MVLGLLEAKAALSASPGEVQVSAVAGQTRPPWDPGQTCGLLSLFARAWSHPSGSRACEGRLAVPGVWVAEGWGQVGAPGRPSAGRVDVVPRARVQVCTSAAWSGRPCSLFSLWL